MENATTSLPIIYLNPSINHFIIKIATTSFQPIIISANHHFIFDKSILYSQFSFLELIIQIILAPPNRKLLKKVSSKPFFCKQKKQKHTIIFYIIENNIAFWKKATKRGQIGNLARGNRRVFKSEI